MLSVTKDIHIPDEEVTLSFIRSSGPGGQNVNKVSTAVQLRFDISNSPSLADEIKRRLLTIAGNRVTSDGVLVIDARNCRTQLRNKEDAVNRLVELIRQATIKPKRRVPSKPTIGSRERRLTRKRQRGELKQSRKQAEED